MRTRLILIRHAHRDTSDRDADNGLSEKGLVQAGWINRYFGTQFSSGDWKKQSGEIYCSPKRRCRETIIPLAKSLKTEIRVEEALDERQSSESFPAFNDRIHSLIQKWQRSSAGLVVACGHGDWLPIAAFHILGVSIEMKKGAWLEVECTDGHGELVSYIPSFIPFYE